MAHSVRPTEQETILIIGGGIIAMASAHYLSDAGYQVTIIDEGKIGGACSAGNCGFICPSHILPLATPGALRSGIASLFNPSAAFRVKFRFDAAFLNWMLQFARRCNTRQMLESGRHLKSLLDSSTDEYRKLFKRGDIDGGQQSKGLLYVFQTARGMEEFGQTDALLNDQFGVAAKRIEGEALRQFDPALRSSLAGAFHYEDDMHMRPDQLNRSWAEQLQRGGVKMVENCRFQSADKAKGSITGVHTSAGPMQADHYILATGSLSAGLAREFGGRIPVEPGKGYSITMDQPKACPSHPMLLPEHHVGITPFADGLRLGSMMEFVGFDQSLPEKRLSQLRQSAELYLDSPLPTSNNEIWFGWRPMTWDSLPIIGRPPGLDNVIYATGHNMLGMTLAPATGRLVTELTTGAVPHIDPEPFSPTRFH